MAIGSQGDVINLAGMPQQPGQDVARRRLPHYDFAVLASTRQETSIRSQRDLMNASCAG
jgi:hypothetical protein